MNIITILVNEESTLETKRTRALTSGNWARALEVDAQLELCRRLRKAVAAQPSEEVIKP